MPEKKFRAKIMNFYQKNSKILKRCILLETDWDTLQYDEQGWQMRANVEPPP